MSSMSPPSQRSAAARNLCLNRCFVQVQSTFVVVVVEHIFN